MIIFENEYGNNCSWPALVVGYFFMLQDVLLLSLKLGFHEEGRNRTGLIPLLRAFFLSFFFFF